MYSIPIPKTILASNIPTKILFNLFVEVSLTRALNHRMTRMANMIICTHLSAQILLSQFSLGKTEPGRVRSITDTSNQIIAGTRNPLELFKGNNFYNINPNFSAFGAKRAPDEAPVFNQL
jgi:hypothetical protein